MPGCREESARLPGDTFGFALGSDPETFDPGAMSGSVEGDVAYQLFEGLLTPAPDDSAPRPGVAERFEVSPDGLRWTFYLRADARWSNGDHVTADDFVYSWLRVLRGDVAGDYVGLFRLIRGGEAFEQKRIGADEVGLRAPDPQTLVVELEHPVGYFGELVSFYPMFPVHRGSIERWGQQQAFTPEHIVSNGPFRMVSYVRRLEIRAERNEHYWGRREVYFAKLSMPVIEDESARVNAFDDGRVDWVNQLPSNQILSLRTRPEFRRTDLLGTYFMRMNVRRPPLDDVRVRRALTLAVNRELLCRCTLSELYRPAAGFVPPLPGYPERRLVEYDPDEARRLLAAAGYPGGKGFGPVSLLYNTSENHKIVAEALQDVWGTELGIEVTLVNQEWKVYLDSLDRGDYQIARGGWIGDYVDPNTFLDIWRGGDENNKTGFSDPAYDALIAEAARAVDPRARVDAFQRAESILLDAAPVLPIYSYAEFHLVHDDVEGWSSNLRDVHLVRYLSKRTTVAP
jgi:oligopeptide transport system substrate-binding protein